MQKPSGISNKFKLKNLELIRNNAIDTKIVKDKFLARIIQKLEWNTKAVPTAMTNAICPCRSKKFSS